VDDRLVKIVVGLAVEGEFVHGRYNQKLLGLYSNPNPNAIKELHSKLENSGNRYERDVAIWLGVIFEQGSYNIDINDILAEIREMEWILYHMLQEISDPSMIDLSDWMNYLVNAAQSLKDGLFVDAKICMNLALEASIKTTIERFKQHSELVYAINLLQIETLRLYEQINRLPFKLAIPEERFNMILKVQSEFIELLRKNHNHLLENEITKLAPSIISRFSSALRYLMNADTEVRKATDELIAVVETLQKTTDRFGKKPEERDERLTANFKRLVETLENNGS
jgi:tRNA isopentenyl-2-thiomethyl-A-37 hydroxylase MiaE